MNNKEIAEDISSIFWDTSLSRDELIKIITSALDKASGKVEPEFEFGERVLVDNLCGGLKSAVYGYRTLDGNYKVLKYGEIATTTISHCIPDPAYAKTLTFVKHDGSDERPVGLKDNTFRIYNSGRMYTGRGIDEEWQDINLYAIIPEGFLS